MDPKDKDPKELYDPLPSTKNLLVILILPLARLLKNLFFVILILPLALHSEESQKGLHSSIGQYIFSDPSQDRYFCRVRMTKIYICTSAVPPPFCPSGIFPVSSGKFTVQNDKKSICQASLNQGEELFTFFSDLLSFHIFNWEITYI